MIRSSVLAAILLATLAALAACTAHPSARSSPEGSPGAEPAPAPGSSARAATIPPGDGKLRIIAFGAHPDDCEIKAGGTAAMWARLGHHVMFVSLTNGDIGHWQMAGGPLARRRAEEAAKADASLGVTSRVLDNHDGEIMPTLENRRKVVRLIREWKADVVLAPRPNDYHPDHRYSAILVQDAAYMVTVPFFVPEVPYLEKNPVFLYYTDRFQRPNPSRADVAVGIDGVLDRKLEALDGMTSQFFEGGANGNPSLVPADEAGRAARHQAVRRSFAGRDQNTANEYRAKLVELYGEEKGRAVKAAEAFEVCEYGGQPSKEEISKLFPFFGKD